MVSLLNGLSSMGTGIAQFAGQAGMEQQRADLAMQQTTLAAQLQHQSRTQEIAQQGTIQSGIVGQQSASAEKVAATEGAARLAAAQAEASAQLGAAGIAAQASEANVGAEIAANAPLVQARVKGAMVETGLAGTQLQTAQKALDISLRLTAESAKPPAQQDQALIASLNAQRATLLLDPTLQAKFLGSIGTMVHGASQLLAADQANEARVLAQQSSLNMGDPSVRAKQEALLNEARAQTATDAAQLRTYEMLSRGLIPEGDKQAIAPPAPGEAPQTPPPNRPPLGSLLRPPGSAPAPAPAAGPAAGPRPGAVPTSYPGLINFNG